MFVVTLIKWARICGQPKWRNPKRILNTFSTRILTGNDSDCGFSRWIRIQTSSSRQGHNNVRSRSHSSQSCRQCSFWITCILYVGVPHPPYKPIEYKRLIRLLGTGCIFAAANTEMTWRVRIFPCWRCSPTNRLCLKRSLRAKSSTPLLSFDANPGIIYTAAEAV